LQGYRCNAVGDGKYFPKYYTYLLRYYTTGDAETPIAGIGNEIEILNIKRAQSTRLLYTCVQYILLYIHHNAK